MNQLLVKFVELINNFIVNIHKENSTTHLSHYDQMVYITYIPVCTLSIVYTV